MRLCEKFGDARVEEACRRALAFDVIDVPRIARLVSSAVATEDEAVERGHVVRFERPRFARDARSFVTIAPEVTP